MKTNQIYRLILLLCLACHWLSLAQAASVYYGPAPFSTAIQTTITTPTLSAAATITNRSRYLISDASTASTTANYLQIGATYSATTGYVAETGTLVSSTAYSPYLSKIFQAIADTYGFDCSSPPRGSHTLRRDYRCPRSGGWCGGADKRVRRALPPEARRAGPEPGG